MSIPPPPRSGSRRGTLASEVNRTMSSGGMLPPPRVSQAKQVARSSSSAEMAPNRAEPKPRASGVTAAPATDEEPSAFSSFFGATVSAPVLSFTSGGIEAEPDAGGEDDKEEEVEWQWSAPSSTAESTPLAAPVEQGTSSMLVDLNAAFGAAFGDTAALAVPKRKGHSRGLSGVFVTPAAPPSATLASSPPTSGPPAISMPLQTEEKLAPATPSSSRRDSVSPRNLLAHKAATAEKNVDKRAEQRERVVRELLSSEQVYVESLRKLIDVFYRPLTGRSVGDESGIIGGRGSFRAPAREASVLSKRDADVLFGQVELIAVYNTRLLQDLKDRLEAPTYRGDQERISEVFFKMKSFLQVYVTYSESYPKAMQVYEAIMSKNSKTRKILKAAEKEAGNVLEAFLILPIQRIPRYILLLKEMVKFTDALHPDYQSLIDAIEAIKQLCAAINEAPRRLQEANEMMATYKLIVPSLPDLLAAGRHLVSQTRVWIINDDGAVKPRILFVFNDMLLVTRAESERFYLRFRIALPNVEVVDSAPVSLGGKQAYIVTLEARQKKIVLAFKEPEEKAQLMDDIAKFNPTIVKGASGFVPLDERPHMIAEAAKSASAPLSLGTGGAGASGSAGVAQSMKSRRASVSLDGGEVKKGFGAMEKEDSAKFSGLLSRKKTVTGTPQGSRKSVKGPVMAAGSEFEIVRTDSGPPLSASPSAPSGFPQLSGSSTSPGAGSGGPASVKPAADTKLLALVAQKLEEQRDLQKLLQFYHKCNDTEGIAEATASIVRTESELNQLKKKMRESGNKPDVAEETSKKRHQRKRSMSTSSLPKMIEGEFSMPSSPKPTAKVAIPASTAVKLAATVEAAAPATKVVSQPPAVVAAAPEPKKGSHALYDFVGVNEGELTCKQGDELTVKSENGEWLLCALVATGKQGWLPKSYCHRGAPKNPFDDD